MAGTVSNTNKVPVWVCFNDTNLGFCNPGDITLTITSSWSDMKFHQTGDYLVDAIFRGARATVQCEFAEIENLDTWVVAFGFGQKQEDTSTPPNERFAFNTIDAVASQWDIATKATSIDANLVLIPQVSYVNATTETDDDIVIPCAFSRDVGDILFSSENNQGLACTFEALLDPTQTDGSNLLYRVRDTGTWSKQT